MEFDEEQLTPEASREYNDFLSIYGRDNGCSCHISPPCEFCVHPGNPRNLIEVEENFITQELHMTPTQEFKIGQEVVTLDSIHHYAGRLNTHAPKGIKVTAILQKEGKPELQYKMDSNWYVASQLVPVEQVKATAINFLIERLRRVTTD